MSETQKPETPKSETPDVPSDPTKVDVDGESNARASRLPPNTDPASGKPLPPPPEPGHNTGVVPPSHVTPPAPKHKG